MGFLAGPIGSAIIGGGIKLGSKLFSRGKSKDMTSVEQGTLNDAMATARQTRDMGGTLFGTGAPLLQAASNYWQKLLTGDRNALLEATAPERLSIERNFEGVDRGIKYGPLRGGARDMAQAEADRVKAGQIGSLVPAARAQAAAGGAQLGLSAAGAGVNANSAASQLFTTLYGTQERTRQYEQERSDRRSDALGGEIGSILTDLLSGFTKSKGGSSRVSSITGGGTSTSYRIPGTSLPGASFAGVHF